MIHQEEWMECHLQNSNQKMAHNTLKSYWELLFDSNFDLMSKNFYHGVYNFALWHAIHNAINDKQWMTQHFQVMTNFWHNFLFLPRGIGDENDACVKLWHTFLSDETTVQNYMKYLTYVYLVTRMANGNKYVKVTVFYIHLYKIYRESYIILTGNLTHWILLHKQKHN